MSYLATMPKPRIQVKVEEAAIRAKALEYARRLLDRGCDWDFVTDITGLRPEDLQAG